MIMSTMAAPFLRKHQTYQCAFCQHVFRNRRSTPVICPRCASRNVHGSINRERRRSVIQEHDDANELAATTVANTEIGVQMARGDHIHRSAAPVTMLHNDATIPMTQFAPGTATAVSGMYLIHDWNVVQPPETPPQEQVIDGDQPSIDPKPRPKRRLILEPPTDA